MNIRQLFQQHVAQTSEAPAGLHIARAEGIRLWDESGKEYLDLIGGISVCNMGHRHPAVLEAIRNQADAYLHVMVYGETIQTPQVRYAELLTVNLPGSLDNVYFTNSGAEATEGAIKLARRVTQRTKIIAAHHSYHGSTTGALALIGDEYWRAAFRPLMPGVWHHWYNSQELIDAIDTDVACVVLETVQAEAGVNRPEKSWLKAVRERCTENGVLLVLDEIQCGFGRTGPLWGFEAYDVVPDILLLGKALGGGLPLGAFIANHALMQTLTHNPVLGHITTFGGHPLSCAAGMASMKALLDEKICEQVAEKEALFHSLLVHPSIKAVRSAGLLMAVELESNEAVKAALSKAMVNGLFSDWFLFAPQCLRIATPLTITEDEIRMVCERLLECL